MTLHSSVLFCASQVRGRLVFSPALPPWHVMAKSPLLAIHSVLTGQQRFRSIDAVYLNMLKVKGSHAIPVSREAGTKPALPRNCKRNEICEDH